MSNNQNRNTLKMRCFVAMRIGDRGTDVVYDRLIKPTIRRIGLNPRRIDRVMHNERIDQKILSELRECHVMISDLTFARPSVYWEAGFVEGRNVQVVYTCRKDHFRPRLGDKHGIYKVHFDLQTKKIIPWTSSRDRKFQRDLERQLRYVLRPLLKNQAQEKERIQEEHSFAAQSMDKRRSMVLKSIILIARRLGFSVRALDFEWALAEPKIGKAVSGSYTLFSAYLIRDRPHVSHTGYVLVCPKLKKSLLMAIDRWKNRPLDSIRTERAGGKGKTVVDNYIVTSFAPISLNLINETLSDFHPDIGMRWSTWSTSISNSTPSASSKRVVRLYVIGNVRSESQTRDVINQILSSIIRPV